MAADVTDQEFRELGRLVREHLHATRAVEEQYERAAEHYFPAAEALAKANPWPAIVTGSHT